MLALMVKPILTLTTANPKNKHMEPWRNLRLFYFE